MFSKSMEKIPKKSRDFQKIKNSTGGFVYNFFIYFFHNIKDYKVQIFLPMSLIGSHILTKRKKIEN